MLANLTADVNCKVVNCLCSLDNLLAYTLTPLKPNLLAYLNEAKSGLSVLRVSHRCNEAFEKCKEFLQKNQ